MKRLDSGMRARGTGGFTLIEAMMATLIASLFLTGLLAAFLQITNQTNRSQKLMRAVANGRTGLDAMVVEIKQANYFPGDFTFIGTSAHMLLPTADPIADPPSVPYGDAVDDDRDGTIDEESSNGLDDDGNWTDADDRHTSITLLTRERPHFVGVPDLGDEDVDEDLLFENDVLTFDILPDPGDPNPRNVRITFYVGVFEGREHVLLKKTETPAPDPGDVADETQISPLADGVLSFSALYWNANGSNPYWVESWDSTPGSPSEFPFLELPAAVFVKLHIYADDPPIETYRAGDAVRVVTVETVVNIEQTINDTRYPRD